ncbi:MAG: hypothetical protein JF588_19230 [Caulobacterales bacterium]|nr:hypothetical protein [Caulobacterales bacterium]
MATIVDMFRRAVRKVYNQTRMPIFAAAIMDRPDGTHAVAFCVEGLNADQMECAAASALDVVMRWAADGDPACPCCADRLARASNALAALRLKPAEQIQSLH